VLRGTKGSDAIPSAKIKDGKLSRKFIEEVDKPQADIESRFEKSVNLALLPFADQLEEGQSWSGCEPSPTQFSLSAV